MRRYGIQFWRASPFIRLLLPLTAGIVLAQYVSISFCLSLLIAIVAAISVIFFRFLSLSQKYTYRWLQGLYLQIIVAAAGSLLIYHQNKTHLPEWVGKYAANTNLFAVTIQEPFIEKANSYKAIASVNAAYMNGQWTTVKGNIVVYIKKSAQPPPLLYGSQIIIQKPLQHITNSGNPGGFDYRQYCAFQDIHFQVYLQPNDYLITGELQQNTLTTLLLHTRDNILRIFRQWVPGETESGVAEALLIGYRNDLDKDLVRAYSNTGVVHIIAISGLHLGMIYGLMLALLKPFRKQRWIRWVKPVLILLVLWGFSLLAGGAASILRSALMFSFIVVGESLGRKTNIYNTLAASAFCLLVYNPYFLWDVGFQLSYTAVVSIVLFMKPIYKCLYFQNKLFNSIWQLNAITLSAQILTLPLVLYYFHQFPNLFLFTNFVAVPLSGFILYAELFLILVYKISFLNLYTGKAISWLIHQMNSFIERTNRISFAVSDSISISLLQTMLLYATIACLAWWLLQKKQYGLLAGTAFLVAFTAIRSFTILHQKKQQQLIVYHIPKHRAMDIVQARSYVFWGDETLRKDSFLQNFHLQPARILNGTKEANSLSHTITHYPLIAGHQKSVMVIDPSFRLPVSNQKIPVDIIIITGNPRIYLNRLAAIFDCSQYVFDSSNPLWKIQYWKKDAESLHLRHHTISEQGAFEVEL